MKNKNFLQITTTVDSLIAAEEIAKLLVEKKLAACVQIRKCNSVYRWQGEVQNEIEYLCVAKTKSELFDKVQQLIITIHPYDVPEVIAVKIEKLSESYKKWLEEETQ